MHLFLNPLKKMRETYHLLLKKMRELLKTKELDRKETREPELTQTRESELAPLNPIEKKENRQLSRVFREEPSKSLTPPKVLHQSTQHTPPSLP
jgi:hypothetical protein